MSDNVISLMETEDCFKCVGPIGPVQSIKLCEGNSIWNRKCGSMCIANPSGR